MNAAAYVIIINSSALVIAAVGFTAAWLQDRTKRVYGQLALSMAVMVSAGVVGLGASDYGASWISRMAVWGFVTMGLYIHSAALARHYGRPLSRTTLVLAAIVPTVLVGATLDMPRDSFARLYLFYGSTGLVALLPLPAILAYRYRGALDWLLAAGLGLLGLQFFVRPALVPLTGGQGIDASQFLGTQFAAVALTMQTVASLIVIAACTLVFVRDAVRSLERTSVHDPLTELLNRRGLEQHAERTRRQLAKRFRPSTVVVADIDHFKAVNDRFGHAAGDVVIRSFARLLKGTARPQDVVARIGGEEFVVLLADASPHVGRLYAEGVRTAMSELRLDAAGGEVVTASFGVSEIGPDQSIDEAIHLADRALYAAKRAGRNRTVVHALAEARGPGRRADDGPARQATV